MQDEESDDNYRRAGRKGRVDVRDGHYVAWVGDHEIWDGADLALIYDTLRTLVRTDKQTAIGVDLSHVRAIPGGFFGMLIAHAEKGRSVRLYSPQPEVRQFLWFREYFQPVDDSTFQLVIPVDTHIALAEPPLERARSLAGTRANETRRRNREKGASD